MLKILLELSQFDLMCGCSVVPGSFEAINTGGWIVDVPLEGIADWGIVAEPLNLKIIF